jgi:methylated-DNA-protein-cysteine methyltransferase-like protein
MRIILCSLYLYHNCIAKIVNKKESNYFELVYEVTRSIPKGRVSTYGAIADFLALGSARMVGWALNQVKKGDKVPAHRVVNRVGELSGRAMFPTPTMMQELLEKEGLKINHDKVEDFKTRFWHPEELMKEK